MRDSSPIAFCIIHTRQDQTPNSKSRIAFLCAGPPQPDQPDAPTATPQDDEQDHAQQEESEEEASDPAPVLDALVAAQQELSIMIDLLTSVEGQRAISVQYADTGPQALRSWHAAAADVAAVRQRLHSGAARLRDAAATLRQQVQEDSAFVAELSQLQVRPSIYMSLFASCQSCQSCRCIALAV